MSAYVEMKDVTKVYQMGEVSIRACDGVNFEIEKGQFVIIVGPSGAGKTTVLNILGGMDTVSSGQVYVDGREISALKGKGMIQYRREDIGFVFQFYNLMQNLTALENVELALQICRNPLDAEEVLADVGLGGRMDNFPAQLSGGEQQRVAIARALASKPDIIFADEPTGDLDTKTSDEVVSLLKMSAKKYNQTLVMITHDEDIAQIADRIFIIEDGKVVSRG